MDKALFTFAMAVVLTLTIWAVKANNVSPAAVLGARSNCVDIQSGQLTDSVGRTLVFGYDEFGYNYQAHSFNGTYDSVDRQLDGTYYGSSGDYVDDKLQMKWSDEWLSNLDCNGDGKLDRGLIGGISDGTSKGWTTNHVNGDYEDTNGQLQHYTYNVKIGYVGVGGDLWEYYTVLQENYQDPTAQSHAKFTTPGLGLNDQWTD